MRSLSETALEFSRGALLAMLPHERVRFFRAVARGYCLDCGYHKEHCLCR